VLVCATAGAEREIGDVSSAKKKRARASSHHSDLSDLASLYTPLFSLKSKIEQIYSRVSIQPRPFRVLLMDEKPLLDSQTTENVYGTMNSDPIVRDNKKMVHAGWEVLPWFLLFLVIIIPAWLFILLPITLLFVGIGKCFSGKAKSAVGNGENLLQVDMENLVPMNNRPFDIVVFGATGFTGKMAAVYIAKRYGSKSFRWAIAGRRRDALESIRSELAAIDSGLDTLPILIANSSDSKSLDEMCRKTRVILTTAGMFFFYRMYSKSAKRV
jgi:hypothetical protein